MPGELEDAPMTHREKAVKWTAITLLAACSAAALLFFHQKIPVQTAADSRLAMEFRSRIQRIADKATDPEDPLALFILRDFVWLWTKSKQYAPRSVESFLADPQVPERQKEIAVWSMQSLELKEFLKFCGAVLNLREEGKVTDNILGQTLFPAYIWNNDLQERYQDPEVRNLLLKIKAKVGQAMENPLLAYYTRYIDRILSGEAALEDKMNFRARIQRIDESKVFNTYAGSLFDSYTFIEIWRQPKRYLKGVRDFLADSQVSEVQKCIAIYSMQSLPLNDFLSFCNTVMELKKDGKITGGLLREAIFPGLDWNTQLQVNYRNPEVRDFLLKIRDSGMLVGEQGHRDYYEEYIGDILSGEEYMNVIDLPGASQLP